MCALECRCVSSYFLIWLPKATDIQDARSSMFRHLLVIRLSHKTDSQKYTWTLPLYPSLSLFLLLSLFQALPHSPVSLFPSRLSLPLSFFLAILLPSLHPSSLHFTLSPSRSKVADGFWLRRFSFLRLWMGEGWCQIAAGKHTSWNFQEPLGVFERTYRSDIFSSCIGACFAHLACR